MGYLALAQAEPPGISNSFSKTEYTVNCDPQAAEELYNLAALYCREVTPVIAARPCLSHATMSRLGSYRSEAV